MSQSIHSDTNALHFAVAVVVAIAVAIAFCCGQHNIKYVFYLCVCL